MSSQSSAQDKPRWPVLLSSDVAVLVLLGTPSHAGQAPSEFARYRYYGFIGFGPSWPEENFGLLGDATGRTAFNLGFGHQIVGVLMGEIEFGIMGREHQVSSPFLSDDPTLSLSWFSYSLLSRFNFGRFEPFVGIGAGQGQADLEVVTEPFAPPDLEIAEDRGLLLLYRAGFDLAAGPKHRFGLDVRWADCEVDLGGFTGGEAQVGGLAALFSYRFTFGNRKLPAATTP